MLSPLDYVPVLNAVQDGDNLETTKERGKTKRKSKGQRGSMMKNTDKSPITGVVVEQTWDRSRHT